MFSSSHLPLFLVPPLVSTKSTLLKSLGIESKYAVKRFSTLRKPKEVIITESTVGIDIDPSLDLSSDMEYIAWDFAGQLEYATLHPVSRYIIVLSIANR